MEVHFSKKLTSDFKGYQYLIRILNIVTQTEDNEIFFDLENTKYLETSILSVIDLIIYECKKKGKTVFLTMPDGKCYLSPNITNIIFNYYAYDKRAFFKPRCIVGNSNSREIEDVLIKYLKLIHLAEYNKIKTIISELKTNIQMHIGNKESDCRGYISSGVFDYKDTINICIVNNVRSIKDNLKLNNIVFESDVEAIDWCLKKENSTRKKEESGGIGLYLLRKFVSQINGRIIIISGKVYISMDPDDFNKENENYIFHSQVIQLDKEFHGTIITLYLPYKTVNNAEQIEERKDMNLQHILESLYGMR